MNGVYEAPQVSDYGSLVELTSAVHLLLGHSAGTDLTFSSPHNAPGPAAGAAGGNPTLAPQAGHVGSGAVAPTVATGGGHHIATPGTGGGGGVGGVVQTGGSGGSGGGAGGGSGGAGGQLPFTGFVVTSAAAIGTGLAAAGSAVKRRLRRPGS